MIVGSTYFFRVYPGFKPKDIDILEVVDYPVDFEHYQQIWLKNKDIFRWVKLPVSTMIQYELESDCPMQVGKYLIPEFCKEIGFTINDLSKLQPLIDNLDPKHKYEKIIYDSYLENNDFRLTDAQRLLAYKEYLKERK